MEKQTKKISVTVDMDFVPFINAFAKANHISLTRFCGLVLTHYFNDCVKHKRCPIFFNDYFMEEISLGNSIDKIKQEQLEEYVRLAKTPWIDFGDDDEY